jgi:hypothetical protein
MTRIVAVTSAALFALTSGAALAATPTAGTAPPATLHASTSKPTAQQAAYLRAQDQTGRQMTKALNELGAAGYFQVKDMHARNGNIIVKAEKNGKSEELRVTPMGQIQPVA